MVEMSADSEHFMLIIENIESFSGLARPGISSPSGPFMKFRQKTSIILNMTIFRKNVVVHRILLGEIMDDYI